MASLVPLAGFIVAIVSNHRSPVDAGEILRMVWLFGWFVALPSLLALLVPRRAWLWWSTLVALTVASVWAAVEINTSTSSTSGLALLVIPELAVFLALAAWVGEMVTAQWRPEVDPSEERDPTVVRFGALVIDTVLVVVVIAFTWPNNQGSQWVAALVVGIVLTTAWSALLARAGGTPGHLAMRLTVVDARTGARIGPVRAAVRTLIVAAEVAGAPTGIFLPVGLLDVLVASGTERSAVDRLCHTRVVGSAGRGGAPTIGGPMAALSRDDVVAVARLARLDLTDEEVDTFTGQLAGILEYAQDVDALDLADVEPTSHPLPLVNVLRADVVTPSVDRDEVLAQAPAVQDHRFKVPPVLGEEP